MPIKKLRNFSDNEIKAHLFVALDQLFKNDAFLLKNKAHERSTAHKLAEYLQRFFPSYHVDCEYNLRGINTKILLRKCNGENKEKVFPDIVIHHRGCDDNLLVIEIKPSKSSNVDKCDDAKLIEFTKQTGDYKYQLGLFIGFNKLDKPQIVWYKNGKQEEE
ncbi:hypothetical protein KKA96_00760 [Patescibacteria group bacterium]|nr:hypothetical protein [Patescibacteria group bacterium]MBU4141461.1 hypothetical protein [Patescibacteria group bacterium]